MSLALVKALPLKPEIRLAQAVSQFEADLSDEQKARFKALRSHYISSPPDIGDVMRLTSEVDKSASSGGVRKSYRMLNFLHGVQQFAALGDVIIGGSQNILACGVWTILRMSLLVSFCPGMIPLIFDRRSYDMLRISNRLHSYL
jgi:ankyrin repeat domain-containing protein 50